MKGFYYLASPYTHKSEAVRNLRAIRANEFAAQLLMAGYFVHQPIWSTHRITQYHNLPVEFEWWEEFNAAFIKASCGVIVCDIDGWKESRGVAHEIRLAQSLGLPVLFCDRKNYTLKELEHA